jgi:hypothetical protein
MSRNAMNECIDAVNEREDQRDTERMERAMYEQPKGPTMTKHTETFYVQATQHGPAQATRYYLMTSRDMAKYGYVYVKSIEVDYEVPDDFDIRGPMVAALDKQIQAVRAEFAKRINDLQDEKAKYLCLEMAATE